MKRELTELARININHAMDVVGGWGIIKNKNNLLANAYQLTPIPITVEGSNILTRSLIIYGQGLIKSHKYIYNIIESLEQNNIPNFKNNINDLIKDTIKIYGKIMVHKLSKLTLTNNLILKSDNLSRQYALLSYMCLINYGPKLKTKEYISGRMADIMSDLYKCYSIHWIKNKLNDKLNDKSKDDFGLLENYCINNLHNKIIDNINLILNDIKSPVKYLSIGVFSNKKILNSDKSITSISNLFLSDNQIKNILTENVFIPTDVNDIRYKLLNWKSDDKLKEEIIKVN